jgi:hypothetical protein
MRLAQTDGFTSVVITIVAIISPALDGLAMGKLSRCNY